MNSSEKNVMVPGPDERVHILRERAEALARSTDDRGGPGEEVTVAEFMLAHESYALELSYIREVYPLTRTSRNQKGLTRRHRDTEIILNVKNTSVVIFLCGLCGFV